MDDYTDYAERIGRLVIYWAGMEAENHEYALNDFGEEHIETLISALSNSSVPEAVETIAYAIKGES